MKMNSLEKYLSKLEESVAMIPSFYGFLKRCKVKYQRTKYYCLKCFGRHPNIIYNRIFFEKNLEFNIPISESMVNIFIKYFSPHSVVDVGCGNAEFLCQFQKKGILIKGYDGSRYAIEKSMVDKEFVELHDLKNLIEPQQKYDLALCLEVAEHIEKKFSERLIENLAKLSDTVIFTAAAPGQGGHFHINEQPREFWIKLWLSKGFHFKEELADTIKKELKANNVLYWYSENLMVFKRG